MKYEIKNTRIENNELIVFYEFGNKEVNTNKFKKTAKVSDIIDWAEKRGKWFDDRDNEIKKLEEDTRLLMEKQNSLEEITQ